MFTLTQNHWKIDDVLGVWPLHGLCGAWGGIAAGIFGGKALGGLGGVSLARPADRHAAGRGLGPAGRPGGLWVDQKLRGGLRLTPRKSTQGADLRHPPDRLDARARGQLVAARPCRAQRLPGDPPRWRWPNMRTKINTDEPKNPVQRPKIADNMSVSR